MPNQVPIATLVASSFFRDMLVVTWKCELWMLSVTPSWSSLKFVGQKNMEHLEILTLLFFPRIEFPLPNKGLKLIKFFFFLFFKRKKKIKKRYQYHVRFDQAGGGDNPTWKTLKSSSNPNIFKPKGVIFATVDCGRWLCWLTTHEYT